MFTRGKIYGRSRDHRSRVAFLAGTALDLELNNLVTYSKFTRPALDTSLPLEKLTLASHLIPTRFSSNAQPSLGPRSVNSSACAPAARQPWHRIGDSSNVQLAISLPPQLCNELVLQ